MTTVFQSTKSNCKTIFDRARFYADSVERDPSMRAADAVTALLFSAIAVESYCADLHTLLQFIRKDNGGKPGDVLRNLLNKFDEIEKDRPNEMLQKKICAIHSTFRQSRIDWGGAPFQEISLLIKIRDSIAHPKPSTNVYDSETQQILLGVKPTIRKALKDRRLITEEQHRLIDELSNPVAAAWAVKQPPIMTRSLGDENLFRGWWANKDFVLKTFLKHFYVFEQPEWLT